MGGDLSRPPNVLKFLHVKMRRKFFKDVLLIAGGDKYCQNLASFLTLFEQKLWLMSIARQDIV